MRVLGIHLSGDGTEWCRLTESGVVVGVISGDALWQVIEQALDEGMIGSDDDPLRIVVGGDIPTGHRIDLPQWQATTPGVEVSLYARWETAAALRAVRWVSGSLSQALRQYGLLAPDAPPRRAAALALDLARRLS